MAIFCSDKSLTPHLSDLLVLLHEQDGPTHYIHSLHDWVPRGIVVPVGIGLAGDLHPVAKEEGLWRQGPGCEVHCLGVYAEAPAGQAATGFLIIEHVADVLERNIF